MIWMDVYVYMGTNGYKCIDGYRFMGVNVHTWK